MSFNSIKWRELKELSREAGFSWGGDAGMELCTSSLDGEVELARFAQLVENRTRKQLLEAAGNADASIALSNVEIASSPERLEAARELYALGHAAGVASRTETIKLTANILHDCITAMQASLIEREFGRGDEAAFQWIINTLAGPGHLPDPDAPFGREAQAFFDANRAEPFPTCSCGRPSNVLWMGKGFCSQQHYVAASAAAAAAVDAGKKS